MRCRLTNLSSLILVSFFLYGCAGNAVKDASVQRSLSQQEIQQNTPAQMAVEQAAKRAEEKRLTVLKKKYMQAASFMSQGHDSKAEDAFLAITKEAPKLSGSWVNLGILAEKKADTALATRYYQQALLSNAKNVQALNNLGLIKRNEGLFGEARGLYNKGLKIDPKNKNLNYNMAVLNELYLNNYPNALKYYQSYVAVLDKPDPKVNRWIRSLKRKSKK